MRSPAPCALLGLSLRQLSPAPSPRPRSWRGWELPAGECWKSSASCATNDFLRQTIRAAGSYRSLLPIPDGSPVLFSPKSHPRAGQGHAALVPPEISGLCCSQVALEGAGRLTVSFSPLFSSKLRHQAQSERFGYKEVKSRLFPTRTHRFGAKREAGVQQGLMLLVPS